MPKRTDISTILIIGAGPIVIGQACEFDYSGTQAVKALKEEGYRVVLVNSNPATIMTDPELADATYIEPITPEIVAKIIEKERHVIPGGFALLPTMGGQTALNCALSLRRQGTLEKFNVEMIGATADAIDKAEDRQLFRKAMEKIGLQTPKSRLANASALKKSVSRQISGRAREAVRRRTRGTRTAMDARRERAPQALPGARARRGADGAVRDRPARDHPPLLHHGRHRRRHRLQQGRISRHHRARSRRLPHQRSADRGIRARLERIRDGGGARQEGQLHHRLLDREPRSDGRAYRRFHHGRAGADADRQGIPDHARRLAGGAARDRRRDRRLQRAVRRQSGRRPHGRDRDEPARVALLRAGLQGDRLSDRQGRGQARGRLHAGRDRQRHHRRRDAGLVRADHRLRRHQDPALCLREIPRRLDHADHLDEVGRRSDGDRPHLPGKPAEGAARARDRPDRPRRDRDRGPRPRRRQERDPRGARHADAEPHPAGRAGDAARLDRRGDLQLLQDRSRGSWRRCAASSRWKTRSASTACRRTRIGMRHAEGDGLFRCAACRARRDHGGRGRGEAPRARRAPGVQAHRHLRGGVRLAHRLHVFDLRGAVRRPARPTRARRPTRRRSSSSAADRTGSARASSSTIAAAMPASRCTTPATRPS